MKWWEEQDILEKYLHANDDSPRTFSFIDGPIHGQQPHGSPPRLGPHLQGRVPALQDHAGFQAALPERLRRPGTVDRGRGREGAEAQRQARDRGLRHRQVRRALQGARQEVRRQADRAVGAAGLLDGLGQLVPHDVRREQLHHLALLEGLPRAWMGVRGHRRDAVVPPLRHRAVRARDSDRGLPGDRPPRPVRQVSLDRPGERGSAGLDDHALDARR